MTEEIPVQQKRKGRLSVSGLMFLFCLLVISSIFLPTTILLFIGMLPTIVAGYIDRTRRKAKTITVGAMNFAGCSPFLFQLWQQGHTYQNSLDIILDPITITIMYIAAAAGYFLDWGMSGVVASFLQQKGIVEQKIIKEKQQELVERWGREVTGDFALDENGFVRPPRV